MKKMNQKTIITKNRRAEAVRNHEIRERLYWAASHDEDMLLERYGTAWDGLTEEGAEAAG